MGRKRRQPWYMDSGARARAAGAVIDAIITPLGLAVLLGVAWYVVKLFPNGIFYGG